MLSSIQETNKKCTYSETLVNDLLPTVFFVKNY